VGGILLTLGRFLFFGISIKPWTTASTQKSGDTENFN
jgi:hypothetical protein